MRSLWFLAPTWALLLSLSLSAVAWAESPGNRKLESDADSGIELFDAIERGDLEVKIIAKDASKGTALFKNKTGKPLSIRLPEAFAAVPVAAQFVPFGGNNAIGGGGLNGGGLLGQQGGANQALGGGFQPFNGGGNNFQPGGLNGGGLNAGGFFKVEPEKVRKLKFVSVCLEHGKPDPRPKIAYELKRLDSYTQDRETIETVKMLARGEIDQKRAQAAAWHFANDKSWEELTKIVGVRHLNGQVEMMFTRDDLVQAKKIADEAQRRAMSEEASPSQASSLASTKQ